MPIESSEAFWKRMERERALVARQSLQVVVDYLAIKARVENEIVDIDAQLSVVPTPRLDGPVEDTKS